MKPKQFNSKHMIIRYNLFFLFILLTSCTNEEKISKSKINSEENKTEFIEAMEKHLAAVANKDLKTLASTFSPDGKVQLILPGEEIMYGAETFIEYHREWFQDTSWRMETEILNSTVGEDFGMAITQLTYHEPDRDGKPYWNRMIVSYDLQKQDNQWYIVKDHCTSVEKSTDVK